MPAILTSNTLLAVSFVLFLAALPLISFGATQGNEPLWWIGLALIVIAGAIPPVTRFVPLAGEEDEEGDEEVEAGDDQNQTGDRS